MRLPNPPLKAATAAKPFVEKRNGGTAVPPFHFEALLRI